MRKIAIVICSHNRIDTLKKTIGKFNECNTKFEFYIQAHRKDSYDYMQFIEEGYNVQFISNSLENQMGKIREKSRQWVCDNLRSDDLIIHADDNVIFDPKEFDDVIAEFIDKDLPFVAAHHRIFEFFQKGNPAYHAGDLVTLSCSYSVFWIVKISTLRQIEYDKKLDILEDLDWAFSYIHKFGNENRFMSKKWNYKKARHEAGGIDNNRKNFEYYNEAAKHFNAKWGGKYVTVIESASKKRNKDGQKLVTVRAAYKKFIEKQNDKQGVIL